MKIIKLNAIDSTNTFLKERCQHFDVENFTVVVAEKQLNGRGQMNAVWLSEDYKNLTFSILLRFDSLEVSKQFYVSKIVSLAIREMLKEYITSKVSIKWPNDILAEQMKICGVLIENSVKKSIIENSIVGIGLNVNQTLFENLPNATSLKLLTNHTFNLDELLHKIVESLRSYVTMLNKGEFSRIDKLYLQNLHKLNVPAMYKNMLTDKLFMGMIVGVTEQGQLKMELEDESVQCFSLKEVQLILK